MAKKTIKNAWSMLIKFGSEENLKKLQSGELYMKNLQYYVDLEKNNSDDDVVGDMYDGQMVLQDVEISMFTVDTHEYIANISASEVSMNLGYLKNPVFCMFMFDFRNHVDEDLHNDILTVGYKFTDEQLKRLPSFGSHALIVKNGNEFVKRIKEGLLANNIGYSRDFVQYYGFNNLEHLTQVQIDNSRIAFWKREKYMYQQEYRFLAHTEVDDHLSINIRDISDITQIITTEQLLNTYFKIGFQVKDISK